MADELKSDRTSVTISKRVHQEFKVACARLGVTQRSLLERIITEWLGEVSWLTETGKFKED